MLQTPFGLSALTYALVAFAVGSLQDSVLRAAWWIPVATAAAGSVVGVILYAVFGTMVGVAFVGISIPKVAIIVGLLNAIAGAADHPRRAVGHGHAGQRPRPRGVPMSAAR